MLAAVNDYFRTLGQAFANGWNRFWFLPSDPYPLGVIRVFTGLIAIWLHVTLLPDLGRLFAAGGWLPVEVIQRTTGRGFPLSYLNFASSPTDLLIAHFLGLAVLMLFTLGFWTRLTSILAFVVMISNVHRAPMITSQVEPIVTMVLFYLCLGPAGASWSLDRLFARRKAIAAGSFVPPVSKSFTATLSLHLMQVHLAMLYAMMGAAKLMGSAWWTGMGVWWLVARPESRLLDLTGMPLFLINFWTHAVVAFELGFSILIWIRLARPLLLGIAVVMWSLMAILTGQIEFSLMMLVANLCYCSPDWLRSCSATFSRRPAGATATA
jgi:hypothetical protein